MIAGDCRAVAAAAARRTPCCFDSLESFGAQGPEEPAVRALLFLRFGVEEIVDHGDDGAGFFHQRHVCRVR